MWTLLFDIDGTLIRTRGAGMKAIQRAMSEMFGVSEIPKVPVHGRTDRAILRDLFLHFSVDLESNIEEFHQRYWAYLPQAMTEIDGVVLPGVPELLRMLGERDDVALGLLTGNAKVPALAKLKHFQLSEYFDFGGYGDDDDCRNEVAAKARRDAEGYLQDSFDPERVWVIGDTVNDIRCARSIGSNVVVVETGGVSGAELADGNPDVQLRDLEDRNGFFRSIFGETAV